MGLSLVSMKRPDSLSAFTTATLAWKRFIPYKTDRTRQSIFDQRVDKYIDLKFLASVLVESPVVIHDIDKLQIVAYADFIIIGVVCWGNLNSTCSELHVDDDIIRDNGDTTVNERVKSKFAM